MTESSRPSVIVDTYSFHKFSTSGYFYFWELAQEYNVVLLIAETDIGSPFLHTLDARGAIARIVKGPDWNRRLAAHRWWAVQFPALLRDLRPAALFVANVHYFHQKYAIRAVRRQSVPVMEGVTEALAERFDDFHCLNGVMSAEEMISQSTIVIGDVSTVRLWAVRAGGRKVISLDFGGIEDGDEMRHYPGIVVARSRKELADLEFMPAGPRRVDPDLRPGVRAYLRDRFGISGGPSPHVR